MAAISPLAALSLAALAAAPPVREVVVLPPPPASLRLTKADRMVAWHRQGVCGVGFSPDGKVVATAGGDHRVRLWEAATGKHLRTFWSHKDFLRLSIFSPDGRLVVSAGNGRDILLWDPATGREVRRLVGHTSDVYTAVFTPDGKTLVSGGFDAHVRVWDVASGKHLRAWQTHQRVVYALAVSPDGNTLATGGDIDNHVRVWDLPTGRRLRSWSGGQGLSCVTCLAFSPDGRWLAGPALDGLGLWDAATGKELRRFPYPRGITKVLFSDDGRLLLAAGHNAEVVGIDLLSGKTILRLGDHGGHRWVWGLTCSPDGRTLLSGGHDGAAVLWDLGGRLRPDPALPTRLSQPDLDALWAELAGDDAAKAYRAVYRLAGDPARAVPMIRKQVRPGGGPALDRARVERLVGELDSEAFAEREKASAELERLCPAALPLLRKSRAKVDSLEVRRRLERILAKYDENEMPAERRRLHRAIHALEQCATPEAQALLKAVAGGAFEARIVEEAEAALRRMAKRATPR